MDNITLERYTTERDFNSLILSRSTILSEMKKCLLSITSVNADLHSRITSVLLPASRKTIKVITTRIQEELDIYELLTIQLNHCQDAINLCRTLMEKKQMSATA
jgi:hypothetical protein